MVKRVGCRVVRAQCRRGLPHLGMADVIAGVWFAAWGSLAWLVIASNGLFSSKEVLAMTFASAFLTGLCLGGRAIRKPDLTLVRCILLGAAIALLALPLLVAMVSYPVESEHAVIYGLEMLILGLVFFGWIIAPMGAIAAILLRLLSKPWRGTLPSPVPAAEHCSPTVRTL